MRHLYRELHVKFLSGTWSRHAEKKEKYVDQRRGLK